MKPILSFSCFLIIFVFTLTIHSPPSTAEEDDCDKFVCDEDWNHLKTGQPYLLGPPHPNQGGDIILESTFEDNSCPRNAIMLEKGLRGQTFTITPTVPNDDGLLPVGATFSIASVEKSSCNESGILRMTPKNKQLKFWHVTADGYFNTSTSCFQLINFPLPTDLGYTPTYLLRHCPEKCGGLALGKAKCFNVGNRTTGYYHYLARGSYPFEFAFRSEHKDLDSI